MTARGQSPCVIPSLVCLKPGVLYGWVPIRRDVCMTWETDRGRSEVLSLLAGKGEAAQGTQCS